MLNERGQGCGQWSRKIKEKDTGSEKVKEKYGGGFAVSIREIKKEKKKKKQYERYEYG